MRHLPVRPAARLTVVAGRRGREDVFDGRILGVGTASGVRIVVGRWDSSPFGSFSDVMVALAAGRRVLVAPDEEIADFVRQTYRFEDVRIAPVTVQGDTTPGAAWHVEAGPLRLRARVGGRTALGRVLRLVPPSWAAAPGFTALTDPIARLALPGVRTRGSAGGGRREFYGAGDMHAVSEVEAEWDGVALGPIAPVTPAPRFGFGGTPRRPGIVAVRTTIRH